MSSRNAHRSALGEFLKARRAELAPHQVGLPETGAMRRVPGLRREEVVQLASISTDYYTRLEQGRIPASAPVLAALARVLHLDDDQRSYLSELAGKDTARPRKRARQAVQPTLQRLLSRPAGSTRGCPSGVPGRGPGCCRGRPRRVTATVRRSTVLGRWREQSPRAVRCVALSCSAMSVNFVRH